MSIVKLNNVNKIYETGKIEVQALRDINLEIESGEFLSFAGPSGSGKTTLLNLIGCLDKPTNGDVYINGTPTATLSKNQLADLRRKNIGFVFQSFNLIPVLTAFENVEFPLLLQAYSSSERKEMVMKALEWVKLTDKQKSRPAQLSGGECQRVAVARAMVKQPQIVLADEPTANLDAKNSHNILQTMEALNRELKTTFIFSTHDDKVIKYLHRKISLEDGQVVNDETLTSN